LSRKISTQQTGAVIPRIAADHKDHQDQVVLAAANRHRSRSGQETTAEVPALPVPGAVTPLQALLALPAILSRTSQIPPPPSPHRSSSHGKRRWEMILHKLHLIRRDF